MAGKKKDKADIESLIATFSAHVSDSYPAPETYSENISSMLSAKREKKGTGYVESLEKNLVFLKDLVTEGEALLEYLLGRINYPEPTSDKIHAALAALEAKVRSGTAGRVEKVFGEEGDDEFAELAGLRGGDEGAYTERLEFNYRYFMTYRMLLFDFIGVMAAVRDEYEVERVDEAAFELIRSNIEMTANFFLGNISVGEVVEDEPSS